MLMPVDRMLIGQNDFVHFYIGGTLFGTPDLHSPEANFAKQRELVGGVLEHSYFVRPTFYGAFYKPLAALSYRTAYLVFQFFSVICCFFFVKWNLRRIPGFAALAIMFPPLLANFVNGQDVILLVTICSLCLVLAESDRDFAAGLVLSLAAFKPHLFLLTPLAVGFHRRWRFLAGATAGLVTLFSIGLTSGGWESQRKLWQMLRNPDSSPYSGIMPTWRGGRFRRARLHFPVSRHGSRNRFSSTPLENVFGSYRVVSRRRAANQFPRLHAGLPSAVARFGSPRQGTAQARLPGSIANGIAFTLFLSAMG